MKVLTVEQIRSAEENAVKSGIFSYGKLMYNAGKAATDIICRKYDIKSKRIAIVCGVGNNGGDGFVIAKELSKMGCFVTVITPLGEPKTEIAKSYFNFSSTVEIKKDFFGDYDFIIDSLFGIGLDRAVEGAAAEVIDRMNLSSATKIAVDLPSGVMADGKIAGRAFLADLTITFIALKSCLLLPDALDYCGEIEVADIGIPVTEYEYMTIEPPIFKKRLKSSHKGTFGTALIIAGSYGMCGAQILATSAALRSGAGIVKAVVCDKNYSPFCVAVPEAVTVPVKTDDFGSFTLSADMLETLYSKADALLLGCGMGQSFSAKQTVINTLKTVKIPTVLDADGINAVSFDINILRRIKAPVIITPHPAEMARLLGCDVKSVEADRIGCAKGFAADTGCITILKGTHTVVATPDGRIFINTTGNNGLATGGSGDVLSGIIVSLLAQGYSPINASLAGVYLHGKAADLAAKKISKASMLPRDIIAELTLLLD